MRPSPSITSWINAYTHGKSGGDVSFIEITKRWDRQVGIHRVVTSALGESLCRAGGLVNAQYIHTTQEKKFESLLKTYMLRIIKGSVYALTLPTPDIIYASSDILPDALPAAIQKLKATLLRRKTVYVQKFFHSFPPDRRVSYWMQRLSLMIIRSFADIVITSSRVSAEDLKNAGVPAKTIHINSLGANLEHILTAQPSKTTYTGVFLGRLKPSKGIYDLPSIWSEVVKKLPHAQLAILGTGDPATMDQLHQAFAEKNLSSNVHLLGFVADDLAFSILKAADLFVFPSHEEGFGIAIAEALAAGLPVVAYNLPVYSDVFPLGGIKYAPSFDPAALGKAASNLLADASELEKLRSEAKKSVTLFSWDECSLREWAIIAPSSLPPTDNTTNQ